MRLWNDYEGTTIAENYPIEKLIRPEGRSAFFSTSNGTGTPAVIRLIESINDESEILSRWKTVADLDETHLVKLKKFGQTVFEGTPLIYVLMETTDADLAGILRERSLTVDETREIATSLVDALQALHGSNIVHEHVEPSNVLATGELVKLRSDCVREAPEGEEGVELKKRDVHDLCVILLQSLTHRRNLEDYGPSRLPAPFDQIIRNGISGAWGLPQIANALSPIVKTPVPAATTAPVPVAAAADMPASKPTPTPAPVAAAVARPATTPAPRPAAPVAAVQQAAAILPKATENASWSRPRTEPVVAERPETASGQLPLRSRIQVPVEEETTRRPLWMIAAPVVIVIAVALGWSAFHKPAHPAETQPITTLSDVEKPAPAPVKPSAANTPPRPQAAAPATADAAHAWRVVAFTYYHQDQAQHKVDQIAGRNPSLHPAVFSAKGGAPYLVTVGGSMTRDDAAAFRNKAAREGLPRDTYIQNYGEKPVVHSRHRR